MNLSVIIPFRNAEKYLDRCLESIIEAFDIASIKGEILLIDNGSTDNSLDIIKKFSQTYPDYVKILRCKTPGAGAARNYGVTKAKCEYIWFIDADDSIRSNAIRLLDSRIEETNADILMIGANRIYADGHKDYLSAVDNFKDDYKSRFVRYGAGPWQFVIRRDWWNQHKFKFREGIIHEDMELMSALILYTDNFACVDKPLYNYYQNPESVLHKTEWDPHYFDIFPALEGLYTRFEKAEAAKEYHDELEWFFIWNLLIDSAKDFSKFREGRSGFRRSRKMLKQYFPNWRKNKFLHQKSLKLRVRVRLNYYKI